MFATNPIGLSAVRLLGISGACLRVADLDVLDGTPVLDIKPFIPVVDHRDHCRVEWMERTIDKAAGRTADGRSGGIDGSNRQRGGS